MNAGTETGRKKTAGEDTGHRMIGGEGGAGPISLRKNKR